MSVDTIAFLVGRNGAGKSNFVDALHLVHDAVSTNLETAVTAHGSPGSLRTVGTTGFAIELRFELANQSADYRVDIRTPGNTFEVAKEDFRTGTGQTWNDLRAAPGNDISTQRSLALSVTAATDSAAKLIYDFVRSMRFYDFSLPAIRALQSPSQGELLRPNGGNLASVLARMDTDRLERLEDYMRQILPGIQKIRREEIGPVEGIRFTMPTGGFFAQHMSTGTLRALAVLVSLLQPPDANGQNVSLVALEEPETALHPAAVGVLLDAIMEASNDRQVMVTTQSPDLLDRKDINPRSMIAVVYGEVGTELGQVDEPTRAALQSHLFTAGELVRLDQITTA